MRRRLAILLAGPRRHRIAAMVERTETGDLELLEARPIGAPPVRVSAGDMQWFPRV